MLTKPRTHEAPTPAACGFNLNEIKITHYKDTNPFRLYQIFCVNKC